MTQGELAQLVEHLLCKQGVIGSNPLFSTQWRWVHRVTLIHERNLTFLDKETHRRNETKSGPASAGSKLESNVSEGVPLMRGVRNTFTIETRDEKVK